jgi:tetratricopeptide (TPR) repeat protein
MTPFWVLILLFVILLISVLGSTYAHYRQQNYVEVQQRIQQIRRNAEFYNELASAMASLTDNKEMPLELNKVAIQYYESILHIDANAAFVLPAIQNAKNFNDTIASDINNNIKTTFNSDAEIAKARGYLTQAERIFRKLKDRGVISLDLFNVFHQELVWLYLRCEVDSLKNQGEMASQRKDKIKSLSYYQTALNTLKKSAIVDPRKQALIKDISQKLQAGNSNE